MSDADQITVAKAIVSALNGAPVGTFSEPFTAARAYRKRVKRQEISGLLVTVIGTGRTFINAARRVAERDVTISVVVQKPVDPAIVADVDGLQLLVQQIGDFLEFDAQGDAAFVSLINDPVLEPALLAENRLFESVIALTYRVQRKD